MSLAVVQPQAQPRRELVLELTLWREPYAWERARDAGGGEYVNPVEYRVWLRWASDCFANAWAEPGQGLRRTAREPLDEPLVLEVVAWLKRPKSRPSMIPRWLWALLTLPAVGRADADNYAAAVMDALQKAKVYVNDTRVTDVIGRKRYLPPGDERERTEVRLWRLVEGSLG